MDQAKAIRGPIEAELLDNLKILYQRGHRLISMPQECQQQQLASLGQVQEFVS